MWFCGCFALGCVWWTAWWFDLGCFGLMFVCLILVVGSFVCVLVFGSALDLVFSGFFLILI